MPRPKTVKINGVDVEYLSVGEGETILFVHGAFNDYRTWNHYMLPVSENHRFVSYSRRYFGTQDWSDDGENFSVATFRDELIGLIEELSLTNVHLVTWSSGVRTAVAAAIARPDLIDSLVLFEPVEPNVFNDTSDYESVETYQQDWNNRWGSVFEHLEIGDNESAAASMYELVFEKDAGSYVTERELVKEIVRQNARTLPVNLSKFNTDPIKLTCEFIKQINQPVLVALGENTHGYWTKLAEKYAECINEATLSILPNTNHYAPLENVDAFASLILAFVEKNKKQPN